MTRKKQPVGIRLQEPSAWYLFTYVAAQSFAKLQVSEAEIDEIWRTGVLDLLLEPGGGTGGDDNRVIPCDDAYLLARFAAGIRSPRIGKLKLAQLGSFGCCAHCPFPGLLARAEAAVSTAAAAAQVPLI